MYYNGFTHTLSREQGPFLCATHKVRGGEGLSIPWAQSSRIIQAALGIRPPRTRTLIPITLIHRVRVNVTSRLRRPELNLRNRIITWVPFCVAIVFLLLSFRFVAGSIQNPNHVALAMGLLCASQAALIGGYFRLGASLGGIRGDLGYLKGLLEGLDQRVASLQEDIDNL